METQLEEVKKKHPRKNPSPQKLVSVADRGLLYPVEIKVEPQEVEDVDAQYEYDGSSSSLSRLPASGQPTQRRSRHRHKSSHHRRKHSKELRVGSPLKAKTKCHKDVAKLKHKRRQSKPEKLDKSKGKVTVDKNNSSKKSQHSSSPVIKDVRVLLEDKKTDSHAKVEPKQQSHVPSRKGDTLHSEKAAAGKKEKHNKRRHKQLEELYKPSKDKQKSQVKASERSSRCVKRAKLNEDLKTNPPKKQKLDAASALTYDGQNPRPSASTQEDASPLRVCSSETDKPLSEATDVCSNGANQVRSPGQVSEAGTHDEESCDSGIKTTDKTESTLREPSQQQGELNLPQPKSEKTGDKSELNMLTEDLLSLNQDSAHLNTVIHRKPTPKKRRTHSRHGKVHSHATPLKLLTPRKSPWKTFSLRVTPHRHSTPSSSCQTPRSTPGSTSGSIPDLHTPKSTPRSAKSERKFQIVRRTPSKVSIKRRLYSAMKTPEKIIDENEDVTNLSFPDITSPESDGIQSCKFEDSPEKLHMKTPESSAKKRSSSSVKFNLSATEKEEDGASSCSEKLNIMSDLDEDPLDQILEEKSKKVQHVHLTAKNVRSIIHQVITNEHVLDMVRNTLKEDGLGDQLKEAIFEPRLTRSMVKEAIQKGTIPLPWSFSPIKVLKEEMIKPGPQFLEMKFSDSEDNDEEYQPSPEELEHADDDEESICSQASDFGSPFPSCVAMSSPCVSKSDVKSDADNTTTTSNMGPPAVTQVPGSKHIKNHYDGTQKVGVDDTQDMTEEEMMIAKRTRSKLPLTDTPLEVIESEFIAPDITPDMYDTHCDDTEWQEFLAGLMKSQDLNDTCDEAEDPEYNFLADDEVDIVDDEDFRNDKAVNIPKREVDELMSELFEAYSGTIVGDENTQDSAGDAVTPGHENSKSVPSNGDEHEPNVPSSPETPVDKQQSTSDSGYPGWLPPLQLNPHMASIVASDIMRIKHNTDLISSVPKLTELELIQLQDQMRKHVQLLAQTFVQCGASDDQLLKSTQNTARSLLLELRVLGEMAELKKGHSYMKPPNLTEAIQITELDLKSDNLEAEELLSKNLSSMLPPKKACEHPLTYKQMDVLVSSPVFVFPQMLPDFALVTDGRCKKRVAFTHAEDNLLAMGFDQFHQLEKRYLYIHKFLLPTKQREQIRFRHKNLRSRHNRQDKCALNYWYENGHLPEFQRYFELEEVADIKAPKYRDPELLPAWFQAYQCTKRQLEPESVDGDSAVLATAGDHASPSSGSSSSCVKNFKRETKKSHSVKKPVAKKLTYDQLKPIATKPPLSGQPNSTVITISSAVPAQNQDSDIGQQVLDTLMSAITDDSTSAVGSTVTANASSMLPLVTVASDNQQAQPIVMLTTSQLEQLGIKVNVIDSPNLGLSTTTSNGQQCVVASSDRSSVCQNVTVSNAPAEAEQGLNMSSQSLISHAFSEATGISLDSLQSETEITTRGPASSEVVSPVVLSDVLMKENNINPNISSIAESNIDNKGDTEGRAKGNNPTGDANSKQNKKDNENISQVSADPQDVLRMASQGSEQDNISSNCSKPCNNAELSRTVHEQSAREPGEQLCDGGVNELASDNTNEINGSPKTLGGCDGGDSTERQGKSPEQTSVSKELVAKCADSEVPGSSGAENDGASPNSSRLTPKHVDGSPIKHTIHVMAELAQLISTPVKISPLKLPHQHRASFMTPRKQSPRKSTLKPLRPLGSVNTSPVKLNLPKKSVIGRPRRYSQSQNRKNFNKKAQSIAPKGFIFQSYVSPVKLAAANISAKARKKTHSKPKAVRVLRALLPKSGTKVSSDPEDDFSAIDNNVNHSFCGFRDQLQREAKMDQDMDGFSETEAGNESQPDEEPMDEEGEDETDRDEDRLAQLMAASTTVRSVAKKSAIGDQKRKKMYKRAALLELLEPDLVDNDPRRDERDTAFAQGYLLKVQQALSDQPEHYERFLKLLYEFGCSDKTPVELYFSIKELLKDHPILLSDFAGFLMPDQAKVCGCLMEHINFKRCREFLRKLEIHFSKQPHTLQRVIKAFAQWQNSSHSDPSDLMATVKPLLKGQPYLLDEFTKFFDNEKPPESCRTEFEEVILPDDSDEEQPEFDGYEEVQFPDGDDDDELYGTKLCRCRCHDNNELKFARRRVHCRSCAVRVVRGHVYLQSSERDLYILQPSVIHHSPSEDTADAEPNSAGDEEMMENTAPPDANNKQKMSNKKLKVKLNSMKKAQGSSLEKVQPNSDVNSLDGFTGQSDTVCEDGRRMNDISQSVSLQVLSCGEEAILSPDGATCQLTNSSSGQVIGPTDFSHMSQEFRKCSNKETEQIESDCIVKDSTGDVRALNSKMEGDDGTEIQCDDSEEGNSQKPHESSTHDSCNLNQVKSDSDNEEEQNMELESKDVDDSSTDANVCGMESSAPVDRQDNDDVDASSDHTSAESDTAPEESAVTWSREDDRLILETCRRDGTGDEVFQNLARTLGKTSDQVMQRFIMMINLLAEDEDGTEASEGEGEE